LPYTCFFIAGGIAAYISKGWILRYFFPQEHIIALKKLLGTNGEDFEGVQRKT
jgi:hypothetical protein